jgi:hypothetical protein
MIVTSTGYAVNTITDLLAIPSTGLMDNFALRVASENAWYQYKSGSTNGLIPSDNPETGRWLPDLEGLKKVLSGSSGNILIDYSGNILYSL